MNALPRPTLVRLATATVAAVLSLALVACNEDAPGGASPTSTGTATEDTPTATGTPSAEPPSSTSSATAAITDEPGANDRLRDLLVSGLAEDSGVAQAALSEIDVIAQPLTLGERNLWIAVSSGSSIYEIDADQPRHVVGIYEELGDESLVEVARIALESEPTETMDVQVLPLHDEYGLPVWIAIDGVTGAHSGTFELLRFDGLTLTSALWWFSPSPGAAAMEDLDGDGMAEIVLDASDPYVFCYACGVREESEIVYRWVELEPVAVNISPVEGNSAVAALTRAAVAYVEADLWRDAREAIADAADVAPDNEDVRWLQIVIDRTAEARLAHAGFERQPLVTFVLAGEYDAAVTLMRQHDPADVFDPNGPLFVGTAAEGFESVAGEYLVDYAARALVLHPDLASAYAARALGRVLVDRAWDDALADMQQAWTLSPGDAFYEAAVEYLADQAGQAPATP